MIVPAFEWAQSTWYIYLRIKWAHKIDAPALHDFPPKPAGRVRRRREAGAVNDDFGTTQRRYLRLRSDSGGRRDAFYCMVGLHEQLAVHADFQRLRV